MPKHYRYPIEMELLTQLQGVHPESKCAGRVCVIHNPTDHHMRTWPMHWRSDRAIVERFCEHGVGHPDFDLIPFWEATGRMYEASHGCCGCCSYDQIIEGLPAREVQEGYFITSIGEVWSYWRSRGPSHGNESYVSATHPPRKLAARPNGKGYLRVQLGGRDRYVHRLMWEAWREPPGELQVRHYDGNPSNNRLSNLRIGDQRANEEDKDRHGTRPLREGHSNSRMTSEIVIEARRLWKADMSLDSIVGLMGLEVNRGTLHEAVTGRTWKSLDGVEPPAPGTHWTKKPEERSRRGWSSS